MIFTSFLPTSVDLSEKFSDFLMHDTVPNMKAAYPMDEDDLYMEEITTTLSISGGPSSAKSG